MYDFLVVGAGLFGATFAHQAQRHGRRVLVVEKAGHVGGHCHTYTDQTTGILVHAYGPHAFHTKSTRIWDFVNRVMPFRPYEHRVRTLAKGREYSLPINLTTLEDVWGVKTADEALAHLESVRVKNPRPQNLRDWALANVGVELYELLIEGYTRKQWGRDPSELPAKILRRLPIRLNRDTRYHDDPHQGIPAEGYTRFVEALLEGSAVELGVDFTKDQARLRGLAHQTLYTGAIDALYDWRFGALEYRTLEFRTELLPTHDHQGIVQLNRADSDVPYTRTVEHRHFDPDGHPRQAQTLVTYETPAQWSPGRDPYYPVDGEESRSLYDRYAQLARSESGMLFGGRLASYRYVDMDQTIAAALSLAEREGLT
jgi:UDP-galactopyranose mutase